MCSSEKTKCLGCRLLRSDSKPRDEAERIDFLDGETEALAEERVDRFEGETDAFARWE